MPGRLTMVGVDRLENRFGAIPVRALVSRYNIAPTADLPVIRSDAPNEIDFLRWQFLPLWPGGPTPKNARADEIHKTQAFKDSFESRRCLVLADGFYEWTGPRGNKQPYRIVRVDGEPFAMAGIWRAQSGGDGETVRCASSSPRSRMKPSSRSTTGCR